MHDAELTITPLKELASDSFDDIAKYVGVKPNENTAQVAAQADSTRVGQQNAQSDNAVHKVQQNDGGGNERYGAERDAAAIADQQKTNTDNDVLIDLRNGTAAGGRKDRDQLVRGVKRLNPKETRTSDF